jgi:hypothetical protein
LQAQTGAAEAYVQLEAAVKAQHNAEVASREAQDRAAASTADAAAAQAAAAQAERRAAAAEERAAELTRALDEERAAPAAPQAAAATSEGGMAERMAAALREGAECIQQAGVAARAEGQGGAAGAAQFAALSAALDRTQMLLTSYDLLCHPTSSSVWRLLIPNTASTRSSHGHCCAGAQHVNSNW